MRSMFFLALPHCEGDDGKDGAMKIRTGQSSKVGLLHGILETRGYKATATSTLQRPKCAWEVSRNMHEPQDGKWSKQLVWAPVSGEVPSASDTSLLCRSVTQKEASHWQIKWQPFRKDMPGTRMQGLKEVSFNSGQGHLLIRSAGVKERAWTYFGQIPKPQSPCFWNEVIIFNLFWGVEIMNIKQPPVSAL